MPTVVVTGASQGIGAAIARAFADQVPGVRLALVARTASKLDAVATTCREAGAEALVVPCDVTEDGAVAQMVAQVQEQFGTPDVLVNNAGVFHPGSILDTEPDAFRLQVDVNLTSAFLVTRGFLPAMMEQGQGHLFFMASVASIRAYAGGSAYCAAKHGLLGLARVVREETKEHGLQVTALMPGATLTPSWEGTELPEERFMPPEDIAQTLIDITRLSRRTVLEEVILRPQEGDI